MRKAIWAALLAPAIMMMISGAGSASASAPPGYVPACGPFEPLIEFDPGSTILSPIGRAMIEMRAVYLSGPTRHLWFRVTAYRSRGGTGRRAWNLARARAAAVLREMARHGFDPGTVEVVIEEAPARVPELAGWVGLYRMLSPQQIAAAKRELQTNRFGSHDICDRPVTPVTKPAERE